MSDNKNIHICLVSAQILANLIPILMDKPEKVILISTKTMMKNGLTKRFQDILSKHDIEYDLYEGMPSTNMPDISNYVADTVVDIQEKYADYNLIYNITGGTKLMSQGFTQGFTEIAKVDDQLIYTDTQHGVIEYLGKNKRQPTPLQAVLTITDYFKANGANYKQAFSDNNNFEEKINARKAVTKYMGENAQILQSLIRDLNGLAHGAGKNKQGALQKVSYNEYKLSRPTQYLKKQPQNERQTLLKKLNDKGILKWKNGKNNQEITFVDVEKTLYIAGGWLEEYVYHIAKDTKPDEVKSGVKISWEHSQKTHNELDVVIIHNNRLLIIECKTSTFGGQLKEKDSGILYKIDSLGEDLKGLYGKVWLVSAQNTKDNMRDRAKDRQIKIIETDGLKNLRKDILDWMAG